MAQYKRQQQKRRWTQMKKRIAILLVLALVLALSG